MGHSVSLAHFYYETLLLPFSQPIFRKILLIEHLIPQNKMCIVFLTRGDYVRQAMIVEKIFQQLEHEIHLYNEKWKDHGGCAKLQPFKSSSLEDVVSGNDTDKENDNDSDVSIPKPKHQKRQCSQLFVLALCTPQMARAHASQYIAMPPLHQIAALFILPTSHPAGGIPLAVQMTSDEKLSIIYSGLCMLSVCLKMSFYHKHFMVMVLAMAQK